MTFFNPFKKSQVVPSVPSSPSISAQQSATKVKEIEGKQANLSKIKSALVAADYPQERIDFFLKAWSGAIDRRGKALSEEECQKLVNVIAHEKKRPMKIINRNKKSQVVPSIPSATADRAI